MNNSPTQPSQRQHNCVSVACINDFQSDNYKHNNNSTSSPAGGDLIFTPINSNKKLEPRNKATPRRFTRKQLLSRPVNRKEKLLYCNNNNNAAITLASTAGSPPPPLPPPRTRGVDVEPGSCDDVRGSAASGPTPAACTVPEQQGEQEKDARVTKVYFDRRSSDANEDDEDKQAPSASSSCKPSPASSAHSLRTRDDDQDSTADHKIIDIKTVHFSSDLDEISRGVQVTPPQFRLRFVPHIQWTCSVRGLCLIVLRVFASQLGLALFLLVWTLLGAAAFHATEGEREAGLVNELRVLEGRLAMDLSAELRQNPPEHRSAWWRTLEQGIRRQEHAIAEALSSGYAPNGGVIWNYAGSLLFAVTMLTTIGFGAPVPRTPLGRTSAVIYSAVSIPLHLLLVVNFGALVADKLELCLRRARRRRCSSERPPAWLSWLPVFAIISYYLFGMVLFGGAPLFPLDFTTAGGVGQRSSTLRTIYAVYLEFAVVLAGISVNVWRNTASSGFIRLGLRLDLLARGRDYPTS